MRVSTIALLTLAALAAQNATGEAKANASSPDVVPNTISDINQAAEPGETLNPLPRTALSVPETLESQEFASGIVAFQSGEGKQIAAVPITPATHQSATEVTQLLEATWLAKLVKVAAQQSPKIRDFTDQIALQTEVSSETSLNIGPTLTLLNALLVVATVLPVATIGFFWLVRRFVIRELVGEVNKRLTKIGELEIKMQTTSNASYRLMAELETHLATAKQSIELLNREADHSKSSIDQIETLKSQFLMQLQVLVSDVQQSKHQAIQEINAISNSAFPELAKSEPQPEATAAISPKRLLKVLKFPPQPQDTFIADDYIKKAEGLVFEGNYEAALELFEEAIALNPNLDAAWYYRGNLLTRLQRYEEALISYDQAIAIAPEKHEAWYNRGNVLAKLQRYEEALASYDQAITMAPEKHEAWYNRGNVLGRLQQYEAAVECYQKVVSLSPDAYEAWYNCGSMLGRLQRYEQAIACYDQVITIKPDFHEVWHNRATMLGKMQQHEAAVASYDQALALKPDRHEAWYNRGNALGKLGRYQEAVTSYEKSLALKPDKYEAWYNRGALLWRLEQYEEALACYDQAIAIKPDDYEVWHNRGATLRKLERYSEALVSYDQAIELQPNCYEAWFGKGEALENLQHYDEAIAAYDKAIAIKPDNIEAQQHRGALLSELKQTV